MRPLLVKISRLWDVSFGKIRIGKRVYIAYASTIVCNRKIK